MTDINEIDFEDLQNKAADLSKAKAWSVYYDDQRKVVLSELMEIAQNKHGIESNVAQETWARRHIRYKMVLRKRRKSTQRFEQLNLEYKLLFERIGIWRTKVSLRKEQMKTR